MNESSKQLQQELDSILDWFESDEFNLDEATKKYQQAQKIIKELNSRLKETKNKITKLTVDLD